MKRIERERERDNYFFVCRNYTQNERENDKFTIK